jgi:hypothetical protein
MNDKLASFIRERTADYAESTLDNLQDLHRILRWDENQPSPQYPGRDWFTANPFAPLEEAP